LEWLASDDEDCDEIIDFIEELIEEWEEPDDDDDYGCVDDRTTPQECLNEWVENYEIPDTWEECYIDEDREVNGKRYSYQIFWGACADYSVNVWFKKSHRFWRNVLISDGESTNQTWNGWGVKTFNFREGGADRVGFRLPGKKKLRVSLATIGW